MHLFKTKRQVARLKFNSPVRMRDFSSFPWGHHWTRTRKMAQGHSELILISVWWESGGWFIIHSSVIICIRTSACSHRAQKLGYLPRVLTTGERGRGGGGERERGMERCETSPEEVRSNVSLTCLNYSFTPSQESLTKTVVNARRKREREQNRCERNRAIFLARPQSEIPELCEWVSEWV